MAGEAMMACPISKDQMRFPSASARTYSRPSSEPTTTRSPQMTGELSTLPRVRKVQMRSPVSRF